MVPDSNFELVVVVATDVRNIEDERLPARAVSVVQVLGLVDDLIILGNDEIWIGLAEQINTSQLFAASSDTEGNASQLGCGIILRQDLLNNKFTTTNGRLVVCQRVRADYLLLAVMFDREAHVSVELKFIEISHHQADLIVATIAIMVLS